MGSCHITHDCKIGNNNILANNTLLAGHVEVEVSSKKLKSLFFYDKFGFINFLCFKHRIRKLIKTLHMQDYVHTAGATVVHQFCHLGSFSFLGGGSVVGLSFYLHGLESICFVTREMIVMQLCKYATVHCTKSKAVGSQHSAEV